MSREFFCKQDDEDFLRILENDKKTCLINIYAEGTMATVCLDKDDLRELGMYCLNQAAIIESKEV